jgi:uncharacterized SAM-binding protein YcdF (DUF218 family)
MNRRCASRLFIAAGAIAYLFSTTLVGHALLMPLERKYGPLRDDQLPASGGSVVVLGSGYDPAGNLPVTAALDADGLARIVEGVRLTRRLGAVRLVVSGGAPAGAASPARGYAKLVRELGISDVSLIESDSSLDTAAQARELAKLLSSVPFLLVTSAYHMPRAMLLMQHAGLSPIAAPTGQETRPEERIRWSSLLPGSAGLRDTERALHEYLGLAAIAIGLE